MMTFEWLENAGAARAFMTGIEDGDCGWEGCTNGSRSAFLNRASIPHEKLVALRQCHGDRVVNVTDADAGSGARDRDGALADADGLMTAAIGIPLAINIADCVPVFLVAPGACALIHAGRAGTAKGIATSAVKALEQHFNVDISLVFAVVGPSAGPCCYRVSPQMRDQWIQKGLPATGENLDLWRANRNQLQAAGIPHAHIQVVERCTICQPGFHSYRAHGTTARNMAILMR